MRQKYAFLHVLGKKMRPAFCNFTVDKKCVSDVFAFEDSFLEGMIILRQKYILTAHESIHWKERSISIFCSLKLPNVLLRFGCDVEIPPKETNAESKLWDARWKHHNITNLFQPLSQPYLEQKLSILDTSRRIQSKLLSFEVNLMVRIMFLK